MTDILKVGDSVKRFNSDHMGMTVGDTAIVTGLSPLGVTLGVSLDKYRGIHASYNLELVNRHKPVSLPEELFTI